MSLLKLAYSNFKRSVRNYVSLIASLSFSIFIFFNFQNLVFSNAMDVLKERNSDYITIIIEVISVVLVIFVFFFIWYATNVFLAQRKKDIGIFTFMGLDNAKIGKMYVIEVGIITVLSLVIGLCSGIIFSKLFTMILLKLSDISVDVSFSFSIFPVIITIVLFMGIFIIMIIKGYLSILRSSVLEMISASKQNELKEEKGIITLIKVIIGIGLISGGYYCALLVGDMSSFIYIFYAVVLVIVGIYFLYDGLIPFVINKLSKNKQYLYQKERLLWINNLAFRLKKNYRTYAIVTILMICSVTVLATSFAMKQRYDSITHFRNTYSYVIMATKQLNEDEINQGISKTNEVDYHNSFNYLILNKDIVKTKYIYSQYGIISYSQLEKAAKDAKMNFDIPELKDNEVVNLTRLYLMDISNPVSNPTIEINKEMYQIIDETSESYLGLIQENINTYIVSDSVYEKLKNIGQEYYMYNYKINNPDNYQASISYLDNLVEENSINYLVNDPNGGDIAWVRVMYSICIFLFLVFILASGSIIFMKLNNEAFEDKERYVILKKMGISNNTLVKSIKNEIRFAYCCPFILMLISSYFSVHALANVMKTELYIINVVSTIVILVMFYIIYKISVLMFKRKVLNGD
ncbi:FtsX-like permease family protein [Thomasclavelia cocleata]|uniref:FtsX-like permease family protein n=1 Tax=Thomasclavelia cocleata TaxID=69824 RepID=UPI00242A816B|nr:ABC transporter permease [Thomasclavelia cocleata]